MRRVLDVVLIAILLGAAGFGAYLIGHRVDHLSNQVSSQDSELQTTTAAAPAVHHGHTIAGTHITPLLVISAVLALFGALILAALINALVKSRRRQRWRLSS
jgi:ABC-type Na+ efflux pump permease subunit